MVLLQGGGVLKNDCKGGAHYSQWKEDFQNFRIITP